MEVKKLDINLMSDNSLTKIKASDSRTETEDDYDNEEFEDYEDDFETDDSEPVQLEKNKTFTQDRLWDIERDNAILMDKILANNKRRNQYKYPTALKGPAISSAAINRKRNQMKINYENQASNIYFYF